MLLVIRLSADCSEFRLQVAMKYYHFLNWSDINICNAVTLYTLMIINNWFIIMVSIKLPQPR